ncbi:MAG: pentapeptide repeat-containing protein [Chitinivibrionales bacterium]|nr:pentapeptide repeat-containing protein [Chitinivibrionales bacterium]
MYNFGTQYTSMRYADNDQAFFEGHQYQLEILMNAVHNNKVFLWNDWRVQSRVTRIDLRGADLSYLDLSGIVLSNADLSFCDLSYSNLENSILYKTNFYFANLKGANLLHADMESAIFARANLVSAMCDGAELLKANLRHVSIQDMYFVGTNSNPSFIGEMY